MDAGDMASGLDVRGRGGWGAGAALSLLEAWGGGLSAALFTQLFKDALHLKQLGVEEREGRRGRRMAERERYTEYPYSPHAEGLQLPYLSRPLFSGLSLP